MLLTLQISKYFQTIAEWIYRQCEIYVFLSDAFFIFYATPWRLPHSGWLIFTDSFETKDLAINDVIRTGNIFVRYDLITIKTKRALLFNKVAPHFNQMGFAWNARRRRKPKIIQSFLYHFSFLFVLLVVACWLCWMSGLLKTTTLFGFENITWILHWHRLIKCFLGIFLSSNLDVSCENHTIFLVRVDRKVLILVWNAIWLVSYASLFVMGIVKGFFRGCMFSIYYWKLLWRCFSLSFLVAVEMAIHTYKW